MVPEQSTSPRTAAAEVEELLNEQQRDEDEIDRSRRYEDFSTVDWIQDSLHERALQARKGTIASLSSSTLRPNAFASRMRRLEGFPGYAWRAMEELAEEGQDWFVVTLVGVGIGLNAAFISIVTEWLTSLKLGYCSSRWWLNEKFCCLEADVEDGDTTCRDWNEWGGGDPLSWIAYVGCAVLFSWTAARLVKSFAPYAAGSGISEIKCILGGFIIKGFLGRWTLAIKSLALPLTIASGLSVGKEGPSVHVACCVGNVTGSFFTRFATSHTKMREIMTAASAAGVAVAFGSPIGGVLFAIEEMSHNFTNRTMWRSFVCALVATVTLSAMNPYRTGKLVLFQVSYDRVWHYFEIPLYIVLGIFGGLYGAFVVKFNLQVASFRRKNLAQHGIAEAVTLATITAVVGYLNKFLRIDMTESLEILFKECEGGGDYDNLCQTWAQWRNVNTLLLATVVRTALVIVSYGCKVPAGIFVPSMAIGATFGRMVGIISKAMHASNPDSSWFGVCEPDIPCITPGTYAFLGAAAALCGVTRMTVTVVVIMFELTGALDYVLPTMIVVLVTKAVAESFNKGGIADQMIKFNGFPFLEKEDKEGHDAEFIEPISRMMKRDIVTMKSTGMPLHEIEDILQTTTVQGFPVVRSEDDATVLGYIRRQELRFATEKGKRQRHLTPTATCTFTMDDDSSTLLRTSHGPSTSTTAAPEGHGEDAPTALFDAEHDHDGWGFDATSEGGGSSRGSEDGRLREAEAGQGSRENCVDFGSYVDQTPLSVSEKLPLEIVMQLFRRMGPRVILVTREGRLVGLVTVKDVLKHESTLEHAADAAEADARRWEERVGLEGVLEEAWNWGTGLFSRRGEGRGHNLDPLARPSDGRPGAVTGITAEDYELSDRRRSHETD